MFHNHDWHGLIGSLSCILTGSVLPLLTTILHIHLPPIILELLQALSYIGAITIAVVTVVKFFKNQK